jgi:hypothetical protein
MNKTTSTVIGLVIGAIAGVGCTALWAKYQDLKVPQDFIDDGNSVGMPPAPDGSMMQGMDAPLGSRAAISSRPSAGPGVSTQSYGGTDPAMATEPAMEPMMLSMKMGLEGKTGDEFDQAFLAEMIAHHQGAVDMANMALVSAGHDDLKAFARMIIAAQESEIARMKQWQRDWYGN